MGENWVKHREKRDVDRNEIAVSYALADDWAIEKLFFDLRLRRVHSPLPICFCNACNLATCRVTDSRTSVLIFFPGTKIVYERTFLMNLRNSPLSHTPPKNIPCHLMKGDHSAFHHHNHQNQLNGTYHPPPHKNNNQQKEKDKSNGWSKVRRSPSVSEDHQFDMDI